MNRNGSISTFFILVFSLAVFAQNEIPNYDFENWSGINPDDWATTNLQGQVINVTQSSDAHNGSWAARGDVVEWSGIPYPPALFSGIGLSLPFPVTQNYATFTGYYKCHVEGQDIGLAVIVTLLDANFQPAAGGIAIFVPAASYTQFSVPLDYTGGSGNDAAFGQIEITIASDGDTPALGTYFLVDHLAFDGVVGIEETDGGSIPTRFQLQQNYPNPFNPSTTIEFTIPITADVQLSVFNTLGQEVAQLVNEHLPAGNYKANWQPLTLAGGIYYYRLTAGDFTETKKLVFMK